ncbi:hypothetical protein XENOCAPTIV_025725 [Xenoophorus captivus]|uniref:Uncharacterized protein n=1 Tax=Xenoophorus captivus TaxID=1517983 RepID=A0ABV0RF32_9TELE
MAVHRWSFVAAVLLLASLDLWCSSSSPPCPKSCTCQRAPLLNCSSSGLSSVPQLILDSITELDLSHNFLSSVTFHQPHPNLTNLWLGNNSIPHLSLCIERTVKGRHLRLRSETGSGSRCLVWAPTLQLLSAERNQLEQLPEGLDAVESLQVLQLSFNRISSLELGILGNLHQLRELHLQHNLITHLHPQMFQNLDQLKSEWWTHSGRASVNQHEARLLISDFSEGDTGLYVCVSGKDQVLSVFKLQISKTGGIRKARSLPRVHSQKSLQETTNWSAGKVTKNLSQCDLTLAVCLSIFITFLVAFILGVLARPCINNLWRRVTKKKAPPATNTATSVQQRHYDNQAFSNAEEPEEIEPHRERRVTFSSVEFTEESNVQYYDSVASGDHESIRSNEVFDYQAAEVELHKHPEEKQRDDSISVDLAVERLRNMEFEHIPDPDELEERRSLSSSSDSSQNALEADQTTRDHTMPKSLHLVEDSLQTRADLSIATKTEIPKTSMKGKSEFPVSPSLHTKKEYPTGSDVSHDDEELFEFSDSAQSPSVKASNLLDPFTSSVHQVKNGYDKKRPGEAPDYSSSSDSTDKEPTQTKIKQKTNKKRKKVALISKLGTHSSSSSSSNSDSEENITFVNVKDRISTKQLSFQKSKTKMYDSDGSWPAVDLQHIPRLKRRLDIKAILPSSDASSSSESEDKPRGHVTKNTQGELKMARFPTNVSQTVSPKPENQKPGFELGQIGIKRPIDIKAPTAYSDSSTSSDSDDETTDNVTKQRKENLLMSKLPTKVSPTTHQKSKNHWPLPNLGKTTEIKKPPSIDSDSSSSSDSDNERKHHETQKKQEELHISKLPTEVTSQKKENQWPALDLGRITRIKRRLDIKAPTADADSDSSSSSDSGDETRGHVTKHKQEELLMSRLPAKVSPTVRPKPENRWPAPNLGKMTEIKKPLDIKAPSTDSDSSSSSDSEDEKKDHMTKQKQDELHISKLPANLITTSQKKENQWPALDLGRITRIKRRLDIKSPTADADSDSSSSSDSGHETRGHVTKQKQEELLMSRLPAKVSPTVRPKPENRWPAPNLGKMTEIKKPLDIKAPSTDSVSSSSSDSEDERKDHMTKQKQDELHISKLPANVTPASQMKENQWPALDLRRITRIKRRLDIKAPTADSSSSSDSDNERKHHGTQKKQAELHISNVPTEVTSQKAENQWPALDLGRITRIKRRLDIKAPTADADSDSSSSSDSGDETRGHVTKQKQEELLMSRLPAKVSPTVRPKPENRWPAPNLRKTTEIKKPLDIKAPSTDSYSSSSSDSDNERKHHGTQKKQAELHISNVPTEVTSQKVENQWPALDLGRITRIKRRLDIKSPTAESSSSSDSGDETKGHVTKQKQEELLMSRLPAKVSPTVRPKPENRWPAPNFGKMTEIKKPLHIKAPSTDSDSSSSSDSEDERKDHMTKQKQDELHISKLPANLTTASQKKENQWPTLDLRQITRIKRRLDIKAPTPDSDSSCSSDSEDEGRGHVMKQKQEELLMSRLPAKVSPIVRPKPENRWPAPNLGKTTEIKKPLDIKAPSTDSYSSSSSDSDNERKHHGTQKKQAELHISNVPTEVTSQKAENQWPALDLGRITRIKRRLDIKAPTAESSSSSDSEDEARGHVTKQKQDELLMSRLPAKVSPTVRPKPENRWPAPNLGKMTEIKKPLDIKAPSTDSDSSSSSDSEDERKDHMTKQKQDELHISKLPANLTTASQKKENQWPALDFGRITRIKRRLDIKAPSADPDSDSSCSSDSEDEGRGHVMKQKQEELLMSRLPAKVSPTVPPKPENHWPAPNLEKTSEIKKPQDIKAPSTDSDSSSSSDSDNERKDHMTKQKKEELHISRDPIKTSQTVSQKQGNQWPSLDLWRIPQFKRHLDIKAPAAYLDLSSSSDSEDDTSCLTENRKPRKSDVGHLSIQETTTKRYDPNGRWPTINLQDIPRIKRHLDFKAPSFKSSFSSESENETKEHVMKQKQKELLMSRLPTKISETVSCKPENHWSPPDLGKTTENKTFLDNKASSPSSDSSSNNTSEDETRGHVKKQKQEELLISRPPAEVTRTGDPKLGHQWPALDLGQIPSIKRRLDINAFIPHQSSLSNNDIVDYSMTIDPSLKSDRDGHVDNKAPSPLLHVGLNIRSLGSKKSTSQSSSSDSEDENRDHRAKFRNAISFSSTASEKKFIRSQNVPGTNIAFSRKTDHNIILKKYNNISGDLENMPTNDSSKTALEVNPELQSRWAAMNLGISRFRKHLEVTSHGTEPSDLTSPPPSNSPFSSSSESGSGKTQRLNRRVVDIKEIRHRGSPPVLENFQVNVSPTLKDPNDKLTFSHVVQQRINSNYSLRNTKDLTTPSNQSSHSSSSSDSEDKTKDHSETDLSRGVPRIKRHLNIKAPSPELSNSPPLLSQNENLTKRNAVQSRQASAFLGPTDESLITYKRSIFKSSLPNSSFTSSGSGHTVNYVSNLSQDGSNDRHISLASKTAPNTSFDDIIKRKLRQSRPKTDGDQLGEIKWNGVGHHLPDLSSSKLRGVNVASTSLQQGSFAELTSPSNDSASGTTDINMLQLSKKSDTTPTNKFSSLGPDGESSSSSDIFHNLGNSSQITNETLMAPIGDKDRKGLNALKLMSEDRRNWEADKDITPLFDVQDGGIFSHSQSEKDIKVLSQQSQIQSPSASDSKREIDLLLLYGVPRYKRHSIGDSLMEASLPDPVTPQPDD